MGRRLGSLFSGGIVELLTAITHYGGLNKAVVELWAIDARGNLYATLLRFCKGLLDLYPG